MSFTFDEAYDADIAPNMSDEERALEASFLEVFSRGSQLAARRRELGLTQEEVADRAGLTQADISRLERGLGNPTEETLERVAVALNARWKHELIGAETVHA